MLKCIKKTVKNIIKQRNLRMKISDINPHIRYASTHYNFLNKPFDSICYDCRLFYVKEGKGTVIINNTEYSYCNNTTIYFPPGTKYHFYLDRDCSSIIMIVIDFDLINDFYYISKSLGTASEHNYDPSRLVTYELPFEFSSVMTKTISKMSDLLFKCCDEFLEQKMFYKETSSALLKLFLMELIRDYDQNNELQKITPILEYIHMNYQNADLTNDDIAQKFNYHPYYLSQMIKQYTGKSLHQYLICYRIKIAQKNLITTDDTIHVIAWKSGFHSTAYFIKTFKEQVGVTPKVYRKEHIQFLF